MQEMVVHGHPVKVCPCNDVSIPHVWRYDTVFIYNKSRCLAQKEIDKIMSYLFDEGFIRDKRTKYYITYYGEDDACDFK
jgi:hypothetical protein